MLAHRPGTLFRKVVDVTHMSKAVAKHQQARREAIQQYERAMRERKRLLGGAWKTDWYHQLAERARDSERRERELWFSFVVPTGDVEAVPCCSACRAPHLRDAA